jgi:hypothetical protein
MVMMGYIEGGLYWNKMVPIFCPTTYNATSFGALNRLKIKPRFKVNYPLAGVGVYASEKADGYIAWTVVLCKDHVCKTWEFVQQFGQNNPLDHPQ